MFSEYDAPIIVYSFESITCSSMGVERVLMDFTFYKKNN